MVRKNSFKAVIFDWNGTLYDDLSLAYGSVVEIFKKCGVHPPPTLEQYREEISAKFIDFYRKYGIGEEFSPDDLNVIRKEFYRNNSNLAKVRPDAVETIKRLKDMGIHVGIVSAEIESVLMETLTKYKIRKSLDFVRGGIHRDKAPVLLEVCQKLSIPPIRAIYVDDTVDGNTAAKNAGLVPLGISMGYNSEDRLNPISFKVIDSLSQVVEFVGNGHKRD